MMPGMVPLDADEVRGAHALSNALKWCCEVWAKHTDGDQSLRRLVSTSLHGDPQAVERTYDEVSHIMHALAARMNTCCVLIDQPHDATLGTMCRRCRGDLVVVTLVPCAQALRSAANGTVADAMLAYDALMLSCQLEGMYEGARVGFSPPKQRAAQGDADAPTA